MSVPSALLEMGQVLISRTPYTGCPLCASNHWETHREISCRRHALYRESIPETMEWKKFLDCEHVFTSGYFDEPSLIEIFRGYQPKLTSIQRIESGRRQSSEILHTVSFIRGAHGGDWVDVGHRFDPTFDSFMLSTAHELGYEAAGIDFHKNVSGLLTKYGVPSFEIPFLSLDDS